MTDLTPFHEYIARARNSFGVGLTASEAVKNALRRSGLLPIDLTRVPSSKWKISSIDGGITWTDDDPECGSVPITSLDLADYAMEALINASRLLTALHQITEDNRFETWRRRLDQIAFGGDTDDIHYTDNLDAYLGDKSELLRELPCTRKDT